MNTNIQERVSLSFPFSCLFFLPTYLLFCQPVTKPSMNLLLHEKSFLLVFWPTPVYLIIPLLVFFFAEL